MLRSLLCASAALAFAALVAPATAPAAPPPGLAYDEIVRVVVNATPPPPGDFQADLAALGSPQTVAASPTPAPKKRGINLGNLAAVIASGGGAGDVAGAAAGNLAANAMDNAVQASLGAQFGALAALAGGFLQPHLFHYAYLNGWERIDDVTAQTATINKCDQRQVIRLDLAHRTYAVYDPSAAPVETLRPVPAPRGGRAAPPDPAQPGTAVVTLTEATRGLGALRIENQPTTGYDTTTTVAMTQATGSCRDANASLETVQYVSALAQPTTRLCPVRRVVVPQTATEAVAPRSGGCTPKFTASRSGPTPPSSRLALYSLVKFSGGGAAAPSPQPSGGPSGVGFLTERGNLKTLGPADAGLFSIPAGFTKATP